MLYLYALGHKDLLYKTMKKVIYFLFLIFFTLSIISCSSSKDDDGIVIPPLPPKDLTEDDIIGTWETYYTQKQVVVNPDKANQASYGGLRLTDYDGFRTTFLKENGKYRAKDYNLAGNLVFEADYRISNDTIRFETEVKTEDGRDSIAKTWQRIREFGVTDGILKIDKSYYGKTKYDGTEFKITDAKATRNTVTAPNSTQGVIPAKVMIDFDDMSNGTWQIYSFREYEDGGLKKAYSDAMTDTMSNVTYKFFLDANDKKWCKFREWDYKNKKWTEPVDFPVIVIDDVIHLLYREEATDEDGNIIKDENGEITYNDESFFLWVTSWEKKDGVDTFIDFKEQRYDANVKVIIKTLMYLRRIGDIDY